MDNISFNYGGDLNLQIFFAKWATNSKIDAFSVFRCKLQWSSLENEFYTFPFVKKVVCWENWLTLGSEWAPILPYSNPFEFLLKIHQPKVEILQFVESYFCKTKCRKQAKVACYKLQYFNFGQMNFQKVKRNRWNINGAK